ncbi:MAG: hypothetical protein ACKO9F_10695 [Caldilinea sp.]|jgi:hypothetical protein
MGPVLQRTCKHRPPCYPTPQSYIQYDSDNQPQLRHDLAVVRPIDPNDKIGPAGLGAQKIVATDSALHYTINFENMPIATAPVQELFITDDLDVNLDWSSLQLTSIAYGGSPL